MTELNGIVPAIAEALHKRGYLELTPVQQAMIDPDLEGRDALVSAQTGSGKTVAFGLALAPTLLGTENRFGRAGAPLALAIAPTRELAMQVMRELAWLYEKTGAVIASCVGGMDCPTTSAGRWSVAPISSSARRAVFATISPAARWICRDCAPWCSMRPTKCSTSASARISNSSWKPRRTIAAP